VATVQRVSFRPESRGPLAAIFEFGRPKEDQRRQVLTNAFAGFELAEETIEKLVVATGDRGDGRPGFTYSDLTQRLVPTAILDAYPDAALSADLLLTVAEDLGPTPPFNDMAAS